MGAANNARIMVEARIMVDAYQLPKHISSRVSQVRQRSLHLLRRGLDLFSVWPCNADSRYDV